MVKQEITLERSASTIATFAVQEEILRMTAGTIVKMAISPGTTLVENQMAYITATLSEQAIGNVVVGALLELYRNDQKVSAAMTDSNGQASWEVKVALGDNNAKFNVIYPGGDVITVDVPEATPVPIEPTPVTSVPKTTIPMESSTDTSYLR